MSPEPASANYPSGDPNLSANRVNQKTFVVSGTHDSVITTITTSATISGITAPCYLVNASTGEIIYAEGISGATFTSCTRGADGSSANQMTTGQILHSVPVANDFNQIIREILAIATYASNANPIQVESVAMSAAQKVIKPDGAIDHNSLLNTHNLTTDIDHTTISNIGTNTHSAIDTFISSKAAASGLASLDANSKVVQNPANATATPTADKIPIADGAGKLDGWITAGSYTLTYADILAVQVFS